MGQKRTISPRRHNLPILLPHHQIAVLVNRRVVRRYQERRA
jgi:hypothetical protein